MPSYVDPLIGLARLAAPFVPAGWLARRGSISKRGWTTAALIACLVVGVTIGVAGVPARVGAAEAAAPQASQEAEAAPPEAETAETESETAPADSKGGETQSEGAKADAVSGPVLQPAEGQVAEAAPEAEKAAPEAEAEEAPAGAEGEEAEAAPDEPAAPAQGPKKIKSWLGGTLFNLFLLAVLLAVLIGPFHLGLRATRRWREPLWGWAIGLVLFGGAVAAAVTALPRLFGFLPVEYGEVFEQYVGNLAKLWPMWVFVGLIAVPAWIGAYLSKRWRMPGYSFRIAVIFFCILAGVVIIVLGWPPKRGIDLSGGVILVYEYGAKTLGEQAAEEETEEGEEDEEAAERADVTLDKLIQAIRLRVDPSNVLELTIRQRGENQIEVIIPEATDEELARIKNKISRAGTLEFRILANRRDHMPLIEQARKMKGLKLEDSDGNLLAWWVPVREGEEERLLRFSDEAETEYRTRTYRGREWTEFLVVKDDFDVHGGYLVRADTSVDESGWKVLFTFNHRGGRLFGALTGNNRPDKTQDFSRHLGIILDRYLQSAPAIKTTIFERGEITGSFTRKEVEDLVDVLNAGSLPTALSEDPVSEIRIGATLGQDTIRRGRIAIAVSLALVLAFMVVYYRFAGLVACMALLMNLIMILAVMISIQAAFTLPGLAGLVLTVGMAVDANVLIFERIREELARQATLRMAIRNGFDRATTAIVDANVTTLIVATVLYVIGTDQIRGFATILWLGVVLSMFTAIYCARVVFDVAEKQKWISKLSMMQFLGSTQVDFLGKRRLAAAASILVIVIGLGAVVLRGSGLLDIDFTGGVSVETVFNEPKPGRISEIRSKLGDEGEGLEDLAVSNLQTLDDPVEGLRFLVNTSGPHDIAKNSRPEQVLAQVEQHIKNAFGPELAHYAMEYTVLPASSGVAQAGEAQNGPGSGDGPEASSDGSAPSAGENEPPADRTRAKIEFEHKLNYETLTAYFREELEQQFETVAAFDLFIDEAFSTADPQAVGTTWYLQLDLPPDQGQAVLAGVEEHVESEPVFPSSNTIGGQVARKTRVDAVAALLASLVFIVGYIWIRFQRVMFGLAAVLALVHDVLITLGVIALTAYLAPFLGFLLIDEFKIGLAVLAAFLTIIGYSLNDTIVVFDRIREVRGKAPQLTKEMINTSINQTLSRTLLTSLTTLIVVVVLYVGGGQGIHVFAFALVVGVVVGTYSSIFVASPVLFWMIRTSGPQRKGKLSSRAA